MPGFKAEMNLPLHGCRTGPGSHFIPLKRQIRHCDSSRRSEREFTPLMKEGAAAVLAHGHSASDQYRVYTSLCRLFLIPLQPLGTGGTSGSPTVRCQWFQFCSSAAETNNATSKKSLHLKHGDHLCGGLRETQTRHKRWQMEEDNILRSRPRHQLSLHWKFLP